MTLASARICDQEYVEILTDVWRRVIGRMATKFLKTEERAPSRRSLVLVRRNMQESRIKNWCVAAHTEVFYYEISGDRIASSDERSGRWNTLNKGLMRQQWKMRDTTLERLLVV